MHAGGRERFETLANFRQRAQAAIGVAEHRGQVAAPGAIHVHTETQSKRRVPVARIHHAVNRVDRAVFGRTQHCNREQHRLALAQACRQSFFQRVQVDAHLALAQ